MKILLLTMVILIGVIIGNRIAVMGERAKMKWYWSLAFIFLIAIWMLIAYYVGKGVI